MANDLGLGRLIEGVQQRDAIHVAVAPVIAAERLVPGTHVGFVKDGDTEHVGVRAKELLGVVDPFLTGFVNIGERFWLFLYPQTITSLRHEWTHPAFEAAPVPALAAPTPPLDPVEESRKAIQAIADDLDITYNQLIRAAERWLVEGDYLTEYGSEHWRDTFPEHAQAFWKHYEIVTGAKVDDHDASFFSCSC